MSMVLLEKLGAVAGLGGIALGVVFAVFSKLANGRSASRQNSRLLVIATWSIGILGIGAWTYTQMAPTSGGKGGNISIQADQSEGADLQLATDGGDSKCGTGGAAGDINAQLGKVKNSTVDGTAVGGSAGGKCSVPSDNP